MDDPKFMQNIAKRPPLHGEHHETTPNSCRTRAPDVEDEGARREQRAPGQHCAQRTSAGASRPVTGDVKILRPPS